MRADTGNIEDAVMYGGQKSDFFVDAFIDSFNNIYILGGSQSFGRADLDYMWLSLSKDLKVKKGYILDSGGFDNANWSHYVKLSDAQDLIVSQTFKWGAGRDDVLIIKGDLNNGILNKIITLGARQAMIMCLLSLSYQLLLCI
jgi:hypothetical protein